MGQISIFMTNFRSNWEVCKSRDYYEHKQKPKGF
jgi:hypothetical protein